MSVKISKKNRTYYSGVTTSTEIRQLVVDKLISYGASYSTGRVPYGVLSKVAEDLFLSSMTVKRVWNYYIVNSTVQPFCAKPGPNHKLTDEDVDYVHQLVIFKPSLYKKEIRELILENSNTNYDSLSVSTIQKTVRERISSIKFTHKQTQRSNMMVDRHEHNLHKEFHDFRHNCLAIFIEICGRGECKSSQFSSPLRFSGIWLQSR